MVGQGSTRVRRGPTFVMRTPDYRKAGFAAGFRWLPAAAELLLAGFGPLAGLAALWLLVSMLAVIPLIGQIAVMLLTPLLTAGAIAAFAQVEAGRRPAPTLLFAAWGRPELRNRLFALGAFGVIGSVLTLVIVASWLGTQVTPEQIQGAQQSPQAMAEMLEQLSFGPLLLLAAGVLAIVMAAMYFAIPLVMFTDSGVAGALGASLRAVFANWAAFLAFGLVFVAMAVALGVVFGLVTLILGLALGGAAQMLTQVLFMLAAMLVQVLMAGAQWVAYKAVFGTPGGDRSETDDQLLA